ncbi:hypothetical protein AVEN_38102-1 [Araneus ventricosus]|uniref:Uncharacterized protein n=1 Tax=Araneus ventricosus TaxID=182803 RepID=A0A4Y2G9I3_ARAVE|nr:hypothetical protein AVEN_38102-1 [Araneus ventricosus]
MIENPWEVVTNRTLTYWKKLWADSVVGCDIEESETLYCGAMVNEIVSLAKIKGLEVDSNAIEEPAELIELHCVSYEEVMEESLTEEEEVTAKTQSSSSIKEMLKAGETRILRSITLIRQWLCAVQIYFIIILYRIFVKF